MIRQDVLIAIDDREGSTKGHWTFIACSAKGDIAIMNAGGGAPSRYAGSDFSPVHYWWTADEKLARKVLKKLHDANARDTINAHFVDYMPFEAIILNAEQMTQEFARQELAGRMTKYFSPLLDEAIAARDKKRITDLFNQFPQSVEKACIADRLKYGKDRFEELHQPGVTIQNWHLECD